MIKLLIFFNLIFMTSCASDFITKFKTPIPQKIKTHIATIGAFQNPDLLITPRLNGQKKYSIKLMYPTDRENDLRYKNIFNLAEKTLSKEFLIDNEKPDFKVIMSVVENVENRTFQIPIQGVVGMSAYQLLGNTYLSYTKGVTGYKNEEYKGYSLGVKLYFAQEVNNKSYIVYDLFIFMHREQVIDVFSNFPILISEAFKTFPLENTRQFSLVEFEGEISYEKCTGITGVFAGLSQCATRNSNTYGLIAD